MAENYETEMDPGQYLVPGEKLMRYSGGVGIKKFSFNACITDRRIFLVDRNEKKPGLISKEIPREVIMGSHLESPGNPDPFLVLTIRTSEDETRTMKIAFIQEGNDRTAEIEEWISLLHGRPLKPVKSSMRHRESPVIVHKEDVHRTKPHEKSPARQNTYHEQVSPGVPHPHAVVKTRSVEHDTPPGAEPITQEQYYPGKAGVPASNAAEVAFCHHCGKKAPAGANFCPFCGTKLHRPNH